MTSLQDINYRLRENQIPIISQQELEFTLSDINVANSFWAAYNDLPAQGAINYLIDTLTKAKRAVSTKFNQTPANHNNSNMNQQDNNNKNKFKNLSYTVFGSKAAICFNRSETTAGFPTILIDAAKSKGPRSFDWEKCIKLQITKAELPSLIAVLYGMLPSVEFKYHGPGKDKGGKITNQGKNLFIEVYAKGEKRATPMYAEDAFYIAMLCLEQLKKSYPSSDMKTLLDTINFTTARMKLC